MSKNDEKEILRRLTHLSRLKPSKEATDRAIKRVRSNLKEKPERPGAGATIRTILASPIVRFAAAAVFLIAVGFVSGRLSSPQPDLKQLQAALQPAISRNLLEQIDHRWQSALAQRCDGLKEELHQQVRRDLTEFAGQILNASGTLTDQRIIELVELIEAARMRDRWRVASALDHIELSRLQDKTQLRNSLQTLAAYASERETKEHD